MSRNGPPSKRGRIDPNQTLSPQEVEQELGRENPSGTTPNRIVLLTVLNAHYPITVDVVHKICKNLGVVDRIVIFQKFFVQAMVEFRDLETAILAKKELHGCDIYSGCCTIKMEYAKTDRLNVRQNDEKTWDFTTDFSSMGHQHQQHSRDMGHSSRRVLLDNKPEMNPPAMQRMPLFDTPSGHHHQGGASGLNYPSLQGGGYSQSSMGGGGGGGGGFSQSSMGGGYGGPGTGGGWGATGGGGVGRMVPDAGAYQGMWGGGYNNAQAAVTPAAMSGAGGGIGGVVMFYQLDPERFNCTGLFNLVCQYGNVAKVWFLKNKEGCAMVEMGDAASADRVLANLNHIVIFDSKVTIERSRKPFIEEIRKPHQLSDGSESYCNFTSSRQNRFATPERAAKNRFIPPTKVLHFYNVPKISNDELSSLFTEVGAAYPARIKWFDAKSGSKSVTGFVEFESVSEACEALVLVNHAKVNKSNESGHYEMKLCFSKANNIGSE